MRWWDLWLWRLISLISRLKPHLRAAQFWEDSFSLNLIIIYLTFLLRYLIGISNSTGWNGLDFSSQSGFFRSPLQRDNASSSGSLWRNPRSPWFPSFPVLEVLLTVPPTYQLCMSHCSPISQLVQAPNSATEITSQFVYLLPFLVHFQLTISNSYKDKDKNTFIVCLLQSPFKHSHSFNPYASCRQMPFLKGIHGFPLF